jgi:hypothetical protein
MSTNSHRRRDLRRVLLDGVVDAQLGLQCNGSSTREELDRAREDLRCFDAESVVIFDRTIGGRTAS